MCPAGPGTGAPAAPRAVCRKGTSPPGTQCRRGGDPCGPWPPDTQGCAVRWSQTREVRAGNPRTVEAMAWGCRRRSPRVCRGRAQAARIVRVAKRRAGGREVGRGPARGAGQKGTWASPRTGALDSGISQRSKVGMEQALELSSRQHPWTDPGSRANYADSREHGREQGRKASLPGLKSQRWCHLFHS